MNDPYGLTSSGLPPDMLAEATSLTRRQQIMQALLAQSQQPYEMAPSVGRFASRASPLQGVAKILQGYVASKGLEDTDKGLAGLAQKRTQLVSDAMLQYERMKSGQPVPPPVTNDEEGNAMPISSGGGDPRAALAWGMTNPLIASSPLLAADIKKTEPNWQVQEQFDQSGRKTKMLVNLNNPSETRPFGGAEQPKFEKVTRANPTTGAPETVFVNPQTQKDAIQEPVKYEGKDTGSKIEPFNPYAPTTLTKTVTPSDVYHRNTQYAIAGLGEDGLPTGDIKTIAKAITDLQLPPLSGFALARPRGQQIMAEVMSQKPDYDAKDYATSQRALNDFASGKNGNQVRFLSTAVDHIQTAKQAAAALQNGDIPLFNKWSQTLAQQTGEAAPTNFDGIKQILGNEIVKGIVGAGGGVGDRDKAQETISRTSSPQQFLGVMDGYEKLMRGQLSGLRRQYEVTTKRKDFDKFLSDQARQEIGGAAPAPSNKAIFDQADAIIGGAK